MNFELMTQTEHDVGRGTALLATGAVVVLLTWVLPTVAPFAVAAYGIYRMVQKKISEGVVALALALLVWYLKYTLIWLLWLSGAVMVGFGLFFLIRGMRSRSTTE